MRLDRNYYVAVDEAGNARPDYQGGSPHLYIGPKVAHNAHHGSGIMIKKVRVVDALMYEQFERYVKSTRLLVSAGLLSTTWLD